MIDKIANLQNFDLKIQRFFQTFFEAIKKKWPHTDSLILEKKNTLRGREDAIKKEESF